MTDKALAHADEFKVTMADVRRYIAPNATDKELFMFMGIAKSYGLNPLKREVHFIKYGQNPGSIVTGYETYLKRAERTGKLDGWEAEVSADGQVATVTIYRKDWSKPFKWAVYRKEFDKGQSTWKTMPSFMLRKVAIAQAFRLCFSDELGGMPYIPEEMPQEKGGGTSYELPKEVVEVKAEAEPETIEPEPDVPDFDKPWEEPEPEVRMITEKQQKRMFAVAKEAGWPTIELKQYLAEVHGITSSKSIPVDRYEKIIEWIESHEGYASKEVEA